MVLDENYDDNEIVKEPFISVCNKLLAAFCVFLFILATLAVIALALYFSISRQNIKRMPIVKEPGFNVSLYARFPNPTQIAVSETTGNVFAGTSADGGIYVVYPHKNHTKILSGLSNPTGVAFHGGSLFVATKDSLLKYENIEKDLKNIGQPKVLTTALNFGVTLNQQRYIKIRNNRIYVMVGSPCNTCPNEVPFGTFRSFHIDGTDPKEHHVGIRNSGGFDWHPVTGDLYFVDEGRDWGSREVPDELNRVLANDTTKNNFGFPFCYGKGLVDPEYNKQGNCAAYKAPEFELGPKSAPRGMTFYNSTKFPVGFRNNVFIAENGVWRNNNKTNYRITRIEFGSSNPYKVFMDGWNLGDIAWGKPSDILNLADGSLLIADSLYGALFRVSYQ